MVLLMIPNCLVVLSQEVYGRDKKFLEDFIKIFVFQWLKEQQRLLLSFCLSLNPFLITRAWLVSVKCSRNNLCCRVRRLGLRATKSKGKAESLPRGHAKEISLIKRPVILNVHHPLGLIPCLAQMLHRRLGQFHSCRSGDEASWVPSVATNVILPLVSRKNTKTKTSQHQLSKKSQPNSEINLSCGNSSCLLSTGDPFPCSNLIKPPRVKYVKGEDNLYCGGDTAFQILSAPRYIPVFIFSQNVAH